MKKTLLLSVVASTMIMAGGDIAPVEPVVEAPVAVEASGWDFSGQAVVYYQTADAAGALDLFEQDASVANVGIQLRAVNKDLFAGIGAGVEVSGLGTWGLEEDVVSNVIQAPAKGGWVSQAYLTYAAGNTSVKLGRQELPKALSPFAFSEGWNVFKNTFDAGLIVNTDLPDTTLVGAVVFKSNGNGPANDMSSFSSINPDGTTGDDTPVYMLTAQNKSIDGLTLTGSVYSSAEAVGEEDLLVLWGDAKFNVSDFSVAVQGGTIDVGQDENTVAFGAKAGAKFGMFGATVAYSSVNENDSSAVHNFGTGVKTPLYTQMILNQGVIKDDASYLKAGVAADVLGGKFIVNYGTRLDSDARGENNPSELDVIFKTKVFNDSTTLLAAYVMVEPDTDADSTNVIRVWGRYNF